MNKTIDPAKMKTAPLNPDQMPQPSSASGCLSRGMAFYARRKYDQAQADLTLATQMDPKLVDGFYGLGMTLKAKGEKVQAEAAFRQVITLLETGTELNAVSAHMLRRLAMGEINAMTKGDWDLAKEIWQKV